MGDAGGVESNEGLVQNVLENWKVGRNEGVGCFRQVLPGYTFKNESMFGSSGKF